MNLVEPRPERLADAVDAALESAHRALRHDADVLSLRRAWRSVAWLAERLDLRDSVQLTIVSVPRLAGALVADERLQIERIVADASLAVFDTDIGTTPQDADRARELARLGADAGVPVVASAAPSLAGVSAATDSIPPLTDGLATVAWSRVRREADARWLALAYPPVQLSSDLLGGGALALAADAGAAYVTEGAAAALGRQRLDATLSVEIPVAAAEQLAARGLAVTAARGGEVRTVAAPSAALPNAPAQTSALSLPAALFASHVARLAAGGLGERWLGDAPYSLTTDGTDVRVTLSSGASPLLETDVSLRLQAS